MSFIVETKDGICHRMDNKCNEVDYTDSKYLICKNKDANGTITLAMFPHERVESIQNNDYLRFVE